MLFLFLISAVMFSIPSLNVVRPSFLKSVSRQAEAISIKAVHTDVSIFNNCPSDSNKTNPSGTSSVI